MATRVTRLEAGAGALADFVNWFEKAREGDVVVYHTGDLQFDRDASNLADPTDVQVQHASAINGVALAVKRAVDVGYLIPSQKRISPGVFDYRATRRLSDTERLHATKVKDAALV
jgi:hypothetical protein